MPAGEWLAAGLGGTVGVVWANGMSRPAQHIRFVRIRSRSELPRPPLAFPGDLPNHLFLTKRGVLALSTVSSLEPYFISLRSTLLGEFN